MAIARAILNYEERSPFYRRQPGVESLNLDKFTGTWLPAFKDTVVEGVRRSGLHDAFNDITIINFNYDRSLDQYLPFAIAATYDVSLEAARVALSNIRVHRPYGQVGRLPWQKGEIPAVDFGYNRWEKLGEIGGLIRTFTERTEEGTAIAELRRDISRAERLVFLGFAFHPQNVELLASPLDENCEVLATVDGMSDDEKAVVQRAIIDEFEMSPRNVSRKLTLAASKCVGFFSDYGRRLKTAI